MDLKSSPSVSRLRNKLSRSQYEKMIAFMENHPALARGKLDSNFTLKRRQQLWSELTSTLNSDRLGVIRTEDKWRKTWSDLKGSAKTKMANVKKQSLGEVPGQYFERLSELEERILKLIGYEQQNDTLECVPENIVKIESDDEEIIEEEIIEEETSVLVVEDPNYDTKQFKADIPSKDIPCAFTGYREKQDFDVDQQNENEEILVPEVDMQDECNEDLDPEKEKTVSVPSCAAENHVNELSNQELSNDVPEPELSTHNLMICSRTPKNKSSRVQIAAIVDFMEDHPELNRSKFDKNFNIKRRQELWAELAEILNAEGMGANKSEEKWRKTWSDFKAKIKAKVAEHRQGYKKRGGPPEKLSDLEKRVLVLVEREAGGDGSKDVEVIGTVQANIQPNIVGEEPLLGTSADVLQVVKGDLKEDENSSLKESTSFGMLANENEVPQGRKRPLLEEISDTLQESKKTKFEEIDFPIQISHLPKSNEFDSSMNSLASSCGYLQGFEATVNALTSTINKYIDIKKIEIALEERSLRLKVQDLKVRERFTRALERIACSKENKRNDS